MKGFVKSLPTEYAPGIIESAENGVDYQFYLGDLVSSEAPATLDIWSDIEFDEDEGEVPRALRCRLLEAGSPVADGLVADGSVEPGPAEQEVLQFYELPPSLLFSKKDVFPAEWTVIELSEWLACGVSEDDPDSARQRMVDNAKQLKANAILSVRYFKTQKSGSASGAELHHYEGRMAFVARKSGQGKLSRQMLQSQIDTNARAEADTMTARRASAVRFNWKLCTICASVALLFGALASYGSVAFLIFLGATVGLGRKMWQDVHIIPKVRHEPLPPENVADAGV